MRILLKVSTADDYWDIESAVTSITKKQARAILDTQAKVLDFLRGIEGARFFGQVRLGYDYGLEVMESREDVQEFAHFVAKNWIPAPKGFRVKAAGVEEVRVEVVTIGFHISGTIRLHFFHKFSSASGCTEDISDAIKEIAR
jgi:hypothetical protein